MSGVETITEVSKQMKEAICNIKKLSKEIEEEESHIVQIGGNPLTETIYELRNLVNELREKNKALEEENAFLRQKLDH